MITLKEVKAMARECARIDSMVLTDNNTEYKSCLQNTMAKKIQMYMGLPFGVGAVP